MRSGFFLETSLGLPFALLAFSAVLSLEMVAGMGSALGEDALSSEESACQPSESAFEPFGLFHAEGWLDLGFTWNPDSPRDRFNGPVNQNDRANEFQVNQLYLIAGRATDPQSDAYSLGFQTDIIYGTDAFYFLALGLDDKIVSDHSSRLYKLAIPQLYAELFAPIGPGVTFQFGKWYTPVGFETGLATQDFFYSRAIGFNITPYSHTGIQASFDLTDQISMSHGLHRGSDVWEDNNNALGYAGMVRWENHDESTAITFACNLGPEQDETADWQDIDGFPGPDAPGENLNRVIYSLTLEQGLTDDLTYILNHDFFFQEGSARFGIEDAEAYGVTQYLIYDCSEALSAGMRLEVYRDDDGFVGSGFRSLNPAAPGTYTNLTLGFNYRPAECLVLRPEIRWDWQDRDQSDATPAFDSGSSTRQFLVSVDAVLSF